MGGTYLSLNVGILQKPYCPTSMVLLKDDTSCLLDVDVETCKNTN